MIYSDYLTRVFIPQIMQFDKMFSETVFPPFADPEAQANKVAQDHWDKKMSEPVGEFGPDGDPGASRTTRIRRASTSSKR